MAIVTLTGRLIRRLLRWRRSTEARSRRGRVGGRGYRRARGDRRGKARAHSCHRVPPRADGRYAMAPLLPRHCGGGSNDPSRVTNRDGDRRATGTERRETQARDEKGEQGTTYFGESTEKALIAGGRAVHDVWSPQFMIHAPPPSPSRSEHGETMTRQVARTTRGSPAVPNPFNAPCHHHSAIASTATPPDKERFPPPE